MSDIAYYDIKNEMRSKRLAELKQLRVEQSRSLQKSIKERGYENSNILKDLLKKNNHIINKEREDVQRIISHLKYLVTNTKDITSNIKHNLTDMENEIQILTTRLS
jgi:cell division septum initiation protein DivIVA